MRKIDTLIFAHLSHAGSLLTAREIARALHMRRRATSAGLRRLAGRGLVEVIAGSPLTYGLTLSALGATAVDDG